MAALESSLSVRVVVCVRLMAGRECRTEVLLDLERLRGGGVPASLRQDGFGGAVLRGGLVCLAVWKGD